MIKSIGITAAMSRRNDPLRYFMAISFWSTTSDPVFSLKYVVIKFKKISRMKIASMAYSRLLS